MASSHFLSETSKNGRRRWLRVHELPFARAFTYRLLELGEVESVLLALPGSKKGVRLVDGDSLDRFLERLAAEQKLEKRACGAEPATSRRKGGATI